MIFQQETTGKGEEVRDEMGAGGRIHKTVGDAAYASGSFARKYRESFDYVTGATE